MGKHLGNAQIWARVGVPLVVALLCGSIISQANSKPYIDNVTAATTKSNPLTVKWCAEIGESEEGIEVIWMGTDENGYWHGTHWGDIGIPPIPAGADIYCYKHRYSSYGTKFFKIDVYGATEPYPYNFTTGLWEWKLRPPPIYLERPIIRSVRTFRGRSVRIRFSSRNRLPLKCRLNRARFRWCSSPAWFYRLRKGRHIFQVRETSRDGRVRGPVSSRVFRIPKRGLR